MCPCRLVWAQLYKICEIVWWRFCHLKLVASFSPSSRRERGGPCTYNYTAASHAACTHSLWAGTCPTAPSTLVYLGSAVLCVLEGKKSQILVSTAISAAVLVATLTMLQLQQMLGSSLLIPHVGSAALFGLLSVC